MSLTMRLQNMSATPGKGRKDANIGNSYRAMAIQQDGWNHSVMPNCGARDTAESLESREAHDDYGQGFRLEW
jgi:hypothetical protein